MPSVLAEAILSITADDSPLRTQLGVVRGYISQQAGLMSGILATVGFAYAARQVLGFEGHMARLTGILSSSAESTDELATMTDRMRQAAIRMGATTMFSATQAADAMKELAQLGFEAEEVLTALPHVTNLAAAGQIDMGEAARFAAEMIRQLDLTADDFGRVSDILVMGANRTSSTVRSMGLAFSYVGSVGRQAGLSMEETAAAIGVLANQGEFGTRAGTTLRTILSQLAKTEFKGKLKDMLGGDFDIRDANNQLLPLPDIIDRFNAAMARLARPDRLAILTELFTQRGAAGFLKLMTAGGDALREFADEFENAGGAANQMRLIMEGTLIGAVMRFRAAISTLFSDMGGRFMIVRLIIGSIQGLVSAFLQAPDSARSFAAGVLEFVTVVTAANLLLPRLVGLLGIVGSMFAAPVVAAYQLAKGLASVVSIGRVFAVVMGLARLAIQALNVPMLILNGLTGTANLLIALLTGEIATLSTIVGVFAGILTGGLIAALALFSAGLAGAFTDESYAPYMKQLLGFIVDISSEIVGAVFGVAGWRGAWESLMDVAYVTLQTIYLFLEANQETITMIAAAVANVLGGAFSVLASIAVPVMTGIVSIFASLGRFISENSETWYEWGVRIIQIAQNVWSFLTTTWDKIAETVGPILEYLTSGSYDWSDALDTVTRVLQEIAYWTNNLGLSWDALTTAIAIVLSEMEDNSEATMNNIYAVIVATISAIAHGFANLGDYVVNVVSTWWDMFSTVAPAIGQIMMFYLDPRNWGESLPDHLIDVLDEAIGTWNTYVQSWADIGSDMGQAWLEAFDEASTPRPGDSPRTKALKQELADILRRMDELDDQERARARDRLERIREELMRRAPGGTRPEQPPGNERLENGKIQIIGILEMARRIQENIQGAQAADRQRQMAAGIDRAANAGEQTVEELQGVREALDRLDLGGEATFTA